MATNPYSPAGQALGFGRTGVAAVDASNNGGLGDILKNQVEDETEDEKRKRMLGLSPLQAGAGGISPAGSALFGSIR
jgi:hypothetical protein